MAWGGKSDLNHGANFFEDYPELAATIREGAGGSLTTVDEAISYLTLDVPGSDVQWKLVATRPMSELLESVNAFRMTFLYIFIGALVLALLVALMISSRITRPIKRLTATAEKVSMGELSESVDIQDKGEIGHLGDAFEIMNTLSRASRDAQRVSEETQLSDSGDSESSAITAAMEQMKVDLARFLGPIVLMDYDDYMEEHGTVRTRDQALQMAHALAMEIGDPVKKKQFIDQVSARLPH